MIDRTRPVFSIDELAPDIGPILKQRYQALPPDDPAAPARFTIYRPVKP